MISVVYRYLDLDCDIDDRETGYSNVLVTQPTERKRKLIRRAVSPLTPIWTCEKCFFYLIPSLDSRVALALCSSSTLHWCAWCTSPGRILWIRIVVCVYSVWLCVCVTHTYTQCVCVCLYVCQCVCSSTVCVCLCVVTDSPRGRELHHLGQSGWSWSPS